MLTSGMPLLTIWYVLFTLGGAGFLLEFPVSLKSAKINNLYSLGGWIFGSALPEQYPIKGFQLTLYPLFLPLGRLSASS